MAKKKNPDIFSGENQIKTLFGISSIYLEVPLSAWENFLQVHLISEDLLRRLLDNDIAWHSKVRCISVCKATENFHCWVKVNELACFLEGFSCSCLLLDRWCNSAVAARRSSSESFMSVPILPIPRAATAVKYPSSRVTFFSTYIDAIKCYCIFKISGSSL